MEGYNVKHLLKLLRLSGLFLCGVAAGNASAQATFNAATGRVVIPTVNVSGTTYRDVTLQLDPDGRFTLVSLTPPAPAATGFEPCTAPTASSLQNPQPRAVFQDAAQMSSVLVGTWQGCDTNGRTVQLRIQPGDIRGTLSKLTTYYATWTLCSYTATSIGGNERSGWLWLRVRSMSCAEGIAKESEGSGMDVYAVGTPGSPTALVIELDGRGVARLTRL